jgi:hypothetical protein
LENVRYRHGNVDAAAATASSKRVTRSSLAVVFRDGQVVTSQ